MGRLTGTVIKDGERGEKAGRHERKEEREGERKAEGEKKQIRPLYSSPFSMILLSYHGYKGNKKRGH